MAIQAVMTIIGPLAAIPAHKAAVRRCLPPARPEERGRAAVPRGAPWGWRTTRRCRKLST